jgi:hypothetical protein
VLVSDGPPHTESIRRGIVGHDLFISRSAILSIRDPEWSAKEEFRESAKEESPVRVEIIDMLEMRTDLRSRSKSSVRIKELMLFFSSILVLERFIVAVIAVWSYLLRISRNAHAVTVVSPTTGGRR